MRSDTICPIEGLVDTSLGVVIAGCHHTEFYIAIVQNVCRVATLLWSEYDYGS